VEALAVKKNHFIEDINKIKNFIATMQDQKEALTAAIAEMNTTIEVERELLSGASAVVSGSLVHLFEK